MRQKPLLRVILEPIGIAVGLAMVVRGAIHIYSIPTKSMSPTLEVGDQIVVTRYFGHHPERGDVIVFRSPADERELLVKRVIALPGDLIDSRLGRVRIGTHTLAEPYVLREATTGTIQSQLIPRDAYFVLGDNREESMDSRTWGLVPRDRIVGRARLVLWSSPVDARNAVRASTGSSVSPERATPHPRVFQWID